MIHLKSKYRNILPFACTAFLMGVGTTAQSAPTVVTEPVTVITPNKHILINRLYDEGVDVSYDPADTAVKGGAFSASYIDPNPGVAGGMDSYLNASIGGYKRGGVWHSADASTGMPVKIKDLDNDLRIQWETFQANGNDADDKWWATINVIFDAGPELAAPISTDRDYDLVIEFERYEQDDLTDRPLVTTPTNAYWWFARNSDGSLRPFVLNIDGKRYEWGVRYKFFQTGHKDNKTHVKFIPLDNNDVAPYLDHPLKTFIDATVEYLDYTDLPPAEEALALSKVALPDLWIKSIAAGYETYTGESTLGNKKFKTVIDGTAPAAVSLANLTEVSSGVKLDWSDSLDSSLEHYAVYRSENGGAVTKLADKVYDSEYIDTSVTAGYSYSYHIVTLDRSFNESSPSNVRSITVSSTPLPGFSDDFPSSTLDSSWVTTGFVAPRDWIAYSGPYAMLMKKNAQAEVSLNTVGYSNVQVSYDRKTIQLDTGEKLFVEWSVDGVSWTLLESTSSSSWASKSFSLPAAAANQPNFRLRFRLNANENVEKAGIDNVQVSGS